MKRSFYPQTGPRNSSHRQTRYRSLVRNGLLVVTVLLLPVALSQAEIIGPAALLKDVHSGPESSYFQHMLNADDEIVFTIEIEDLQYTMALWRSDGTPQGTKQFSTLDCYYFWMSSLVYADGILFHECSGDIGWPPPPWGSFTDLYRVNLDNGDLTLLGTWEGGTETAKYPSPQICCFVSLDSMLYFYASSGELWRSDGTPAGTAAIASLTEPSPTIPHLTAMIDHNGSLYAVVDNGLWRSDGTAAGTTQIKALTASTYWSSKLTILNGRLFFVLDDGIHGSELWTSDGTDAGTTLLKDINPGEGNSSPTGLKGVGDLLFFFADDGTHGQELWGSDGTEAGTALVKDINTGPDGSCDYYGDGNVGVGERLFFAADDGIHGIELWSSGGTEAGTMLVKDINPNGSGVPYFRAYTNVVVDDTLVFSADDGIHGRELWQSDGSVEGTVLVQDINPGSADSYPGWMTLGEKIVAFGADDGTVGYELWALSLVDGVDGWISAPIVRSGEPSEQVGISVSYGNLAGTIATSTTLTTALDPALAYITDTSGITPVVSGTLLAWPLPDLGFLDEGGFEVTVQMPADDMGTCYPIFWTLASDGPEVDPENNEAQTSVCHFPWRWYLPLVHR